MADDTTAEIRYDSVEHAQRAMEELNGSLVDGKPITITPVETSKDGTKMLVHGLPRNIQWQELKDHFKQIGTVAFVQIHKGGGQGVEGEIRYDSSEHAMQAIAELNGSEFFGSTITVDLDARSKDACKLKVTGLPATTQWQELKDHFSPIGAVAYAGVNGGKAKGGGKGFVGSMPAFMPFLGMNGGWGGFDLGGWGGKGGWGKAPSGGKGGFAGASPYSKGGKGGKAGTCSAELRYDNPAHAQMALMLLNGAPFNGSTLSIMFDQSSNDGSKLVVLGVPQGTKWQELKDYFATIGQVAFVQVAGEGGKGGGGKGGKGGGVLKAGW